MDISKSYKESFLGTAEYTARPLDTSKDIRDTLRKDAKETLDKLKAVGITPMLLTGDNAYAAAAIAESAGIGDVHANLLPEEKRNIIKEYSGGQEPVCMVGDGVNDALALAGADAGIAMGGIGSDIAVESADAVLVSDEIKQALSGIISVPCL